MRMFAGIPFLERTLDEATQEVIESAASGSQASYHLVNAYSIAASTETKEYQRVLSESEHNLPDGFPIAFLTQFSKRPLRQVRGPSLFTEVIAKSQNKPVKHYFLGSSEQVLHLIVSKIQTEYSGAHIAGVLSPPFRELSDLEREVQAKKIIDSGANLVWVALGTPKQDIEADLLAKETGKTVLAVGAAFDFFAGTKAEAPGWMSRLGLEWTFRLGTEPKRLWRRYLIGNFQFLTQVMKGWIER